MSLSLSCMMRSGALSLNAQTNDQSGKVNSLRPGPYGEGLGSRPRVVLQKINALRLALFDLVKGSPLYRIIPGEKYGVDFRKERDVFLALDCRLTLRLPRSQLGERMSDQRIVMMQVHG